MSDNERIYAVALLTRAEVEVLGVAFQRLWPVDETPCFGSLLHAIDEADREIRRARDLQALSKPHPVEPPA